MILKILGFADILAVVALLTATILPKSLVIIMVIYLIIKGVFFMITSSNLITNFLDVISGIYLLAASYSISHWILTAIVIIFLGQKAIISLL